MSKTHAAAHPAATADCSPATSRTSAWYAWGNQTNASICPLPCRSHRLPRPAAIFVRLSGDHPQGRRSSDAPTNPEDEDEDVPAHRDLPARPLFLLFGDDAGWWKQNLFYLFVLDGIKSENLGSQLDALFAVLNTPESKRRMDVARHRLAEANSPIVALLVPNGRSHENSAADVFAYSVEKQLEHAFRELVRAVTMDTKQYKNYGGIMSQGMRVAWRCKRIFTMQKSLAHLALRAQGVNNRELSSAARTREPRSGCNPELGYHL
ncbi:methylase [Corynebacterium diphtheriae bv. gravis str. ISS 4746]|nr:putative methylase [Corynebacterium diphtheriae str. Aberdeen]KLN37579.1 methylase [Corynebacterium diphtheriae bv. gravis str. ISS 4746]KLN43308.1 methylase [Corynebacterium diphtheriae bv. gravis str. ISS 4749]